MGMVERVARALQDRDECFAPDEPLDSGHLANARAAIEAMREPTKAMCEAGDDTSIEEGEHIDEQKAWRRMIDAALRD